MPLPISELSYNMDGSVASGEMSASEVSSMMKSLTAGYETNVQGMQGGSALRIQSLDHTLQATVQDNKHFVLFNSLPKPKATAVLDEWSEQKSIGGYLGDSFNDQDGAAEETNGDYQRRVGRVKYLTTYRKVPVVLQQQNNIEDPVTLEQINGAKQLLTSIEFAMFEGNEDVLPKQFTGIRKQLEDMKSADHVIDMRGQPLDEITSISKAAETIFGFGNFGTLTDLFIAPAVQSDLNNHLDPAFRVALDNNANSTVVGSNVRAIQTSWGAVSTRNNVFIRDEKMMLPFELLGTHQAKTANRLSGNKPATVTAVAEAGEADSYWNGDHAGTYTYFVTAINSKGESLAVGATGGAVTVAGSKQVRITITPTVGGEETGYVIYRGRQDGTAELSDTREMCRIPKAFGEATTVYIDKNREIPGTTCAYALNLLPTDHAIDWRQFMPMFRMDMAAVNSPIIPWLQMICGYLRITKRNQHAVIKNIVPRGSVWKPFKAK